MPTFTTRVTYPFAKWSYDITAANPGVINDVVPRIGSEQPLIDGVEQTTRNSNPYWKTQISKRQDASTSYFRSGYRNVRIATAIFRGTAPGITWIESRYRQLAQFPNALGPVTDPGLDDLALTRLKRKLKKHIGQFDSMVPILELKDLKTTVKGLAEITTKAIVTLAEIKKTKGRSAYNYASKAWLTYSFGVRPLMKDMKDICNSISTFLLRQDHVAKLTGSSKATWMNNFKAEGLVGGLYHSRTDYSHVVNTLSYRYTAGLNLNIKSSNDYGAMEHFGLEPPSLIPAIWEAMAFSWVVDYFTNVGDLLDDTFNSPPGNCLYCVKNIRYTAVIDETLQFVLTGPVTPLVNRPALSHIEYFHFTRLPYGTALPHLGLRIRSIDEIGQFAVGKLLNLASILGSKNQNYGIR